jgi:hypothetical protein
MSNASVGISVIGYSNWWPNLVRNFATNESACVIGVADLTAANLAKLRPLPSRGRDHPGRSRPAAEPAGRGHHRSGPAIALGLTSSVAFTTWWAGLVAWSSPTINS